MRAVIVVALALMAGLTSAAALEVIGQAGVLGEWELSANLTAAGGKQDFAGPIVLKHTGICSADGPETRTGEMKLHMASASRVKASLTIEGNPCTYSATKSDAFVGMMSCRDRRDVPLRLWIK